MFLSKVTEEDVSQGNLTIRVFANKPFDNKYNILILKLLTMKNLLIWLMFFYTQ